MCGYDCGQSVRRRRGEVFGRKVGGCDSFRVEALSVCGALEVVNIGSDGVEPKVVLPCIETRKLDHEDMVGQRDE